MSKTRNEALLDFQRRLIRTACRSPRIEAMNLLGIVYSNLREFIQVRVPLDRDPDALMDQFFEVLEVFDGALKTLFTNIYLDNNGGNDELVFQDLKKHVMNEAHVTEMSDYDVMTRIKDALIKDGKVQPGIMTQDGQHFYHYITVFNAARKIMRSINTCYVEELMLSCIKESTTIKGATSRIAAPKAPIPSNEAAIGHITKWLHQSTSELSPEIMVTFKHQPSEEHLKVTSWRTSFEYGLDDEDYRHYDVDLSNFLLVDFDRVAKFILTNYDKLEDRGLRYAEDGERLSSFRGCTHSHNGDGYGSTLWRGPWGNGLITHLCNEMGIYMPSAEGDTIEKLRNYVDNGALVKDMQSKEPKRWSAVAYKAEDGSLKSHVFHEKDEEDPHYQKPTRLRSCYMTIYRTGKDLSDWNRRFITTMAIALKENCHIFIECRARGDEANNIAFYKELCEIGADVRAVSEKYFDKKIHAKVWTFCYDKFTMPHNSPKNFITNLYSTGNFVDSAQAGFCDTALIETIDRCDSRAFNPTTPFWNGLCGQTVDFGSYDEDDKLPMTWKPKKIRKALLEQINTTAALAASDAEHQYFIKIKCNHLTDPKIIAALKRAVKYDVQVDILARTTCLMPNMYRDNLTMQSIMGQYLEHDRLYIFGRDDPDGTNPQVRHCYMSTADLMPRNLDDRIEYLLELPDYGPELYRIFESMAYGGSLPEGGFFKYSLQ